MLSPEITRIVLLIGLAATGYLMILAWTDDQAQNQEDSTYNEAPLLSDPSATGDPAAEIGVAPVGNQAQSSDIPDASLLVGQDTPAPRPNQPSPAVDQLITVETPSLKVWINLVGGDIVRVELPKFPIALEEPDKPYVLLDTSATHTYIAQSGLIGEHGLDGQGSRPVYATSQQNYRVAAGETKTIVLTTESDGAEVEKQFSFRSDDYLVDVAYAVNNRRDTPFRAGMFAQLKRDGKAPPNDESFALGIQPYVGGALTTPDERYRKVDFEDLDEQPLQETVDGGWMAVLQHYFLSAWVAPAEQPNRYYARRTGDGMYIFGYTGPLVEVLPGSSATWEARFYAGPKDQKRLEEISPNLNLTVDYGFLWWLAVPLFYMLDWLFGVSGNWGVAIILLTIVVKAVLYPLSAAGYKSMANMRRVAPQMKKLQERYADDREKLSREMMALYKKEGANPLGGCLPMILPMPIFIALYWVLFESVELRQAPFILWIEDLAQMDPYFVLPLLMGASTYLMQSMSPQVGDPMQVKMMKMMPIMFTVLFLFFPAGLVLYWLVNNLLSMAQQWYVIKKTEKAQAAS
jgi:YidC/Oxa1 family membrane protein insertase